MANKIPPIFFSQKNVFFFSHSLLSQFKAELAKKTDFLAQNGQKKFHPFFLPKKCFFLTVSLMTKPF